MSLKFTIFWLILAGLATAKDIPRMPVETLISPTIPYASATTPAPSFYGRLFKRAIATCGFVRGNSAAPVTCSEGYNCVIAGKYSTGFACCNDVECLNNWGLCRPYGQKGCMGNALDDETCASIYGPILQCSQAAPWCVQYAVSASLGAAETYYSLACGATSQTILLLETATNAAKQTAAGYPTAQSDVSDSLPGFTSVPNDSSPTTASSARSSPSSSSSDGKPLSTRFIIVIAVVGAGVLVFALAVGCWFWNRRRKNVQHVVDPANMNQADYQPTVSGTVRTWIAKTPFGADPNIPPTVNGSVYGGPSASKAPRPMTTLLE